MPRPGPELPAARPPLGALALVTLVALLAAAPARAQASPITTCGQKLTTGTYELLEDLDCSLHGRDATTATGPGVPDPRYGLVVEGHDVVIEGNGFRLLAPDAARAISSVNFKNVTVRNLIVDGWCNGTGIYIEGGAHGPVDPGHVLENIQANGRSKGVHLKGTSKIQIRGLTTDSASDAGLDLENVSQSAESPLILRDLDLKNSLIGLRVSAFNGQNATCSGNVRACNYTFHAGLPSGLDANANAAVLTSVEDSDTGLLFSGNVTNTTVLGRATGPQDVVFNGTTAGINANAATNANLTFQDLDVSTSLGTGTGLYVSGANLELANILANRRSDGVRADTVTNLAVRKVDAQGATVRGLYLNGVTAPLFLEELSLVDCTTALSINNFGPPAAAQFAITRWVAGVGGTIKSVADSSTGLTLANVRDITIGVAPAVPTAPDYSLKFGNSTTGVDASSSQNARLTFTNLDLTAVTSSQLGTGLILGGAGHSLSFVRSARRYYGLTLQGLTGAATSLSDIAVAQSLYGLYLTDFSAGSTAPTFARVNLRNNSTALGIFRWMIPYTFDPSKIDTPPLATPSGIDIAESTNGIRVSGSRSLSFVGLRLAHSGVGLSSVIPAVSIHSWVNEDIVLQDIDASGLGGGVGVSIRHGERITITNLTAHRRTTGLELQGVNAVTVLGLSARNCTTGLTMTNFHGVYGAPEYSAVTVHPLVVTPDLTNNGTALAMTSWQLTNSVAQPYFVVSGVEPDPMALPASGILAPRLSESDISLAFATVKSVSVEDLALDGTSQGLYLSACEDLKVTGVDLSGPGRGTGLWSASGGATVRGGRDLVLRDVIAANRATGVALVGNRLTLDDVTLQHNTLALSITKNLGGVVGETQVAPSLRNLRIDDNGTGLSLTSVEGAAGAPWVLGPYDLPTTTGALASLQGNGTPLLLKSCRYVAIQGPASPAAPFAISGRGFGIDAQTGNADLTFRDLAIDTLAGRGLALKGSGHLIENVTLDTSQYGLDLEAVTDPILRRVRSTRAFGAGFRLRSAVINAGMIVEGLELVDNAVGLLVQTTSGTGTLALNATAITELGGNRTDLTVTTAPNVTVDQASLAVTATPVTGGSSYSRALPTSDPICGTTLLADLILADNAPDIDCRGTLGGAALTVGANGLTIDLKGRAILAPHVDVVIAASDRDDLTLKNADLSGTYSRGTGFDVVGGDRVTVTDVLANRRNQGASFRGLVGNALGAVTVSGFTANGTGTLSAADVPLGGGLSISAATTRPSLTGLMLARGVGAGLTLDALDGAAVGLPWVLGAAQLVDLSGQGVSIDLTNGVRNVTFAGPIAGLDGLTAGIRSRTGPDAGLTYQDLALSALYPSGIGLETLGNDLTVSDCVASRRATGFSVRGGTDLSLSEVTATENTYGLELSGFSGAQPYPSLTNLDLRDNATALRLRQWTAPLIFDAAKAAALEWTGSSKAIEVYGSSGIVFSGLSVSTPFGIFANNDSTSSSLSVLDSTFSGPGRGTALTLFGAGHQVERVTAEGFSTGVQLQYASGAVVRDLVARRNKGTGFEFWYLALDDTPPILERLTLTDNGTGLDLYSIKLTAGWTLDNGAGSTLALDVSGSGTGIALGASSNVTLSRFTGLANRGYGVRLENGTNCTLQDVEADGEGLGRGVFVRGGPGHRLTRVRARWRDYGVDTYSPDGLVMRDVSARFSNVGMQISYLSSGTAPDLGNADLSDNGTGLLFWVSSLPVTVHPNDGLSVKRSLAGIAGTGGFVSNVTVADFVDANVLDNPSVGIGGEIANLTVRNVHASGLGRGVGIQANRAGALIEDVIVADRATGISVTDGSNLTMRRASVARISGAGVAISYIPPPPAARPELSGLAIWDSGVGFELSNASGSATEPLAFDDTTFVGGILDGQARTALDGNLTDLQFRSSVRYATLRKLRLAGSIAGFDGGYASAWSNRYLTLEDVDATGQCRGTGLDLRGQDHLVVRGDLSRRGTGVRVQEGDRVRLEDSVVGSNVKGVRVDGTSTVVDTTVVPRTSGPNTTTSFRVGSLGYMYVGQPLVLHYTDAGVGLQTRTITALDTTNRIVTISSANPLPVAPPDNTAVRSEDWLAAGHPRLTIEDSDLCANGRNSITTYALHSGTQPVITSNDYWRSSTGPTHGQNLPGTGDFVTAETTRSATGWTMPSIQSVPTDKANDYCNQAPVPEAGPAQEACAGDPVALDGGGSYDPDCGASAALMSGCAQPSVSALDTTKERFTYAWTQRAGLSVSLSNAAQSLASFTAPTPPAGSNTTTLSFSLVVEDDLIPRTDTTSVLVRRRNLPPTAAAQGPTAVTEGSTGVPLSSTGSADAESLPLGYAWVQTGGPTVSLSNPSAGSPTFDAPQVGADALVTFGLTVTDAVPPEHCGGAQTATASVSVLIRDQATGCPPEDPDCEPCLGVPDGTVIATDVPCPAELCETPPSSLTGDVLCQGGQPTSTCPSDSLPDTSCDASVTVSYAIVYDAARKPRGTIRCAKDALDVVTCDEVPGEPGVLQIYPDLWCTGVSP